MSSRWKMARVHATTSTRGWLACLALSPFFALRLLVLRIGYFFKRRLLFPTRDPNGFQIDSVNLLLVYWAIAVELEMRDPAWATGFCAAHHPVAVDVGANAGVFTYVLHRMNPGAKLTAIEPLPDMAEKLERLGTQFRMNLRVISAAASDRAGSAPLFAQAHDDTGASLAAVADADAKPAYTIRTVTLDEVITDPEVFLLKVDTERQELAVLRGARNVLRRTRHLILEILDPSDLAPIVDFLGSEWTSRRITTGDFLFTRKPTASALPPAAP
ncbi:MAG: FkbM family methyltransferase [Verrucomicrobia bacterium]|nr:FkbM family methyltransferase [Verrucomicrobiota bacterium]